MPSVHVHLIETQQAQMKSLPTANCHCPLCFSQLSIRPFYLPLFLHFLLLTSLTQIKYVHVNFTSNLLFILYLQTICSLYFATNADPFLAFNVLIIAPFMLAKSNKPHKTTSTGRYLPEKLSNIFYFANNIFYPSDVELSRRPLYHVFLVVLAERKSHRLPF